VAPEKRSDPGQKLSPVKGLNQIIVGTAVEARNTVLSISAGSQHENRNLAVLAAANPVTDFDAIDPREPQVEYDQIRSEINKILEGLWTIMS
jgi:hypothetical protein